MKWGKLGRKTGFTIIEVILVLAIVAALFIGLMAQQGNNLARRRFEDSLNSFVAFMQGQYDFGMNIENFREGGGLPGDACPAIGGRAPARDGGRGRTNCMIYGIILEFGQNQDDDCNHDTRTGNCYLRWSWVVGTDHEQIMRAELQHGGRNIWGLDDFIILRNAHLRRVRPHQDYLLEWGGFLQAPFIDGARAFNGANGVQGAIVILRLPVTGSIMTFIYRGNPATAQPNGPGLASVFNFDAGGTGLINADAAAGPHGSIGWIVNHARGQMVGPGGFETTGNLNDTRRYKFICINSPDVGRIGTGIGQRIMAIEQGGSNASAIQLLPQDIFDDQGRIEINGGHFNVRCE